MKISIQENLLGGNSKTLIMWFPIDEVTHAGMLKIIGEAVYTGTLHGHTRCTLLYDSASQDARAFEIAVVTEVGADSDCIIAELTSTIEDIVRDNRRPGEA